MLQHASVHQVCIFVIFHSLMGHNNGHTLLYVVLGPQLCTISACGIFTDSSYTKYQDCTTICSSVMAHFVTELCQAWPGDLDF